MKPNTLSSFLFVLLTLVALSPTVQAVVPPPDGGYPGGNTAEGQNALFSVTSGTLNTAVGFFSLRSDTEGNFNTATGAGTLLFNTGDQNTALGAAALFFNVSGSGRTAVGASALLNNTSGSYNTAVGISVLLSNNADGNTGVGSGALSTNSSSTYNTAVGSPTLDVNTTADKNTAIGSFALHNNTTGPENTAIGFFALYGNTIASYNTAVGSQALNQNTTGEFNTAIGVAALGLNTTGNSNIALGATAGEDLTTGDFNIDIGNQGVADEAHTIRIGDNNQTKTFIAGIRGVTTGQANAIPVLIDGNGQLGTMSSSSRFKDDIEPMDKESEAILALKPVSFHYKNDKTNRPEFGLIAENVAEVNPDLVVRDANGEIYTVRYDAVNAMLLNEFLKEHRKVQEQDTTIALLKSADAKQEATIAKQQMQIEALTTGLQKVSAQLEASKPALQTVKNNQ